MDATAEAILDGLDDAQRMAATAVRGPVRIIAGAGAGKTRTVTRRIAYACATKAWDPRATLAVTFSVKAAAEMRNRLSQLDVASDVKAATFHSAALHQLRRIWPDVCEGPMPFISRNPREIVEHSLRRVTTQQDDDTIRNLQAEINWCKISLIAPEDYERVCAAIHHQPPAGLEPSQFVDVYKAYETEKTNRNEIDFDDILLITCHLIESDEDVAASIRSGITWLTVDEYQDVSPLQHRLLTRWLGDNRNICVVGDDDQSIYRFRGANIENILSFEKQYAGARTIRLEQNYRSTQNILDAANAVIRHNVGRKDKTLWTENGAGEVVTVKTCFNEGDEANYVVGQIMMNYRRGVNWKDNAVLYRMNAQSNALEYAFKRNGVPYKIIGGTKFFDRAEVKDMLAYLCVINNPADDLRLRRIVNVPARKIGAATMDKAQVIATEEGLPLMEVLRRAGDYPQLKASAGKLTTFTEMIDEMRRQADDMGLVEFYEYVCRRSGYVGMLQEKNDVESRGRLENVEELSSSIQAFLENDPENPTLSGFLDEVALYTDLDSQEAGDNCVTLMTMHSAKGLEFPSVFVVGMEDGLFPGNRAMGEPEEMEEERRLCYVAMTRAKEKLTLTSARQRMLFGRTTPCMPSRFLKEIPEENMEWLGKPEPRPASSWDDFGDGPAYAPQREARPGTERPAHPERPVRPAAASAPLLQLQPGDGVRHSAFGQGMVLSVRPMGGDALVEVAFDRVGTKRLMLKAAGAHLVKL